MGETDLKIANIANVAFLALAVASLEFAASSPALAQTRGYAVSGTIADQDGRGIADAEVGLLDHDRVSRLVRSDTAGRFELTGLANAAPTLRIRHMGFAPRDVALKIPESAHRAAVIVTLDVAAAELSGVEVSASLGASDELLRGFNARRESNSFGRYIDAAMIEQRRPQFISEALRSVPGVSVNASRGGNTVRIRGCAPLIWLDGVRVPGAQLDDVVRPADVAGMEIYSSFAGIPAQYFDRTATCGTILVWMKAQ
jgi:hypothetical protein